MDNLSFTDEQLLNLVNRSIEKYTDKQVSQFTGGSVQITSTHNNKVQNYKVTLFFGYNNRNPVNKSFDIQEGMVSIWMKALLIKIKTMQAIDNGMDYSELNELMNVTTSKVVSNEVDSNIVESSSISISRPRTTIVRQSYDNDFERFWMLYPKKVGKKDAQKAWSKAWPNIDEVEFALSWQVETDQWQKQNGAFIPNPSTYINQGRWQDEPQLERVPF